MDGTIETCGLATWGVVRLPWRSIAQHRRNPGPGAAALSELPNLKLADEQTVVAMAAVLHACHRVGWSPNQFRDWGVLAAPRFLGRTRVTQGLMRFREKGARSVSPLLIPTLCQHSTAGTLCLLLGCHGPNLGVGGDASSTGEIILNALSLLEAQHCAGIWVVLTAWNPEPIPDGNGQTQTQTTGIGVALALTPERAGGELRLDFSSVPEDAADESRSLFDLADFLEQSTVGSAWRLTIPGTGIIEIVPEKNASVPLRRAG